MKVYGIKLKMRVVQEDKMGKTKQGKRDGTGPREGSYQRRSGKKGKRKLNGEKCIN